MPCRSPFTTLCGQLARLNRPQKIDLHIHTTASDGNYSPSQAVALARAAGLSALAITDHDTFAGLPEASLALDHSIELISGVELSVAFNQRELHVLAYFARADNAILQSRLQEVCDSRRERFRDFVKLLRESGIALAEGLINRMEAVSTSLGRRHVASLIVEQGAARHLSEAFHRFVFPMQGRVRPKQLIPFEEAIALAIQAGGITSLAHPPDFLNEKDYRLMKETGLHALEVVYPWGRQSPANKLRDLADRLGFARTGGSDCHGPQPTNRRIGSHGIAREELTTLRSLAS